MRVKIKNIVSIWQVDKVVAQKQMIEYLKEKQRIDDKIRSSD